MGGAWDATNVADAQVAVVTPIAIDHTHFLGSTITEIAGEKAGILKPGSYGVLAQQPVEAAEVLLRRSVEVDAIVAREGLEFGVMARTLAVGGQLVSLRGLAGEYDDVFLPLLGAHQAHNAACALAAVEAFLGGAHAERGPLDVDLVRAGVRRRDLAGAPGDRPQLADRGARRRAQPGRRPRDRRGGGGVLRVQPAGRRVRRDGRQGRPRHARGARAGARRGRGHASRPPAGRCRPTSWRRSRSRCSAPTGSRWPPGWTTPSTRPSRWPRRRAHFGGAGVLVTGSIVTVARGAHPAGRELTVRVPAS